MPVTPDQARAIAYLAVACRPDRASTWDAAGVVAMIRRVADRDLAAVTLAVIRAAADPNANTPGVIPTDGPHWSERLATPKWTPEVLAGTERCSVCSQREDRCRSRWASDHDFLPAAHAARRGLPASAAKSVVDELRDIAATARTTTEETDA